MARNELVQGLADAIAGGALAGLSKEADMDFFGPFMQAQQRRLERTEQKEATAYTNFSQSSKASREAFSSDPLREGGYEAYVSRAQQRLQMALDNTTAPAARQALTDTYEADIAFADSAVRRAKEDRYMDLGMQGNFGWLGTDEQSASTATRLFGEGSPLSKTFAAAQVFAEQFRDQSTGVYDANALPSGVLTKEENELVTLVGQVDGGLPQFVQSNPEEGRRIAELLSKVDPSSLKARAEEVTRIRDDRQFFGRLAARAENVPDVAGRLKGLNDEQLWQIKDGQRSFRDTAIGGVIETALAAVPSGTRNAAVAWQMVENTYGDIPGVDLSNIQAEIFSQGNLGTASVPDAAALVSSVKDAGAEIFEEGIPSLPMQQQRAVARGDLTPLIDKGYSPEAARALGELYQSNGRRLVLEPVMQSFLGTEEQRAAELNMWQDKLDFHAARGEERQGQEAEQRIKELQAFQTNSAVDTKIGSVTELLLRGAASGEWDPFILAVGRESQGLLDSATGKLSEGAQKAWDDEVMREGLSPANRLRRAAAWASTYNIVFHQDSQIETGGGVKLNPLAQAKFQDTVEKWAQLIESEQMAMGAEGRGFLQVEDDIFAPQFAFLKLVTTDSVYDFGGTKNQQAAREQMAEERALNRAREDY